MHPGAAGADRVRVNTYEALHGPWPRITTSCTRPAACCTRPGLRLWIRCICGARCRTPTRTTALPDAGFRDHRRTGRVIADHRNLLNAAGGATWLLSRWWAAPVRRHPPPGLQIDRRIRADYFEPERKSIKKCSTRNNKIRKALPCCSAAKYRLSWAKLTSEKARFCLDTQQKEYRTVIMHRINCDSSINLSVPYKKKKNCTRRRRWIVTVAEARPTLHSTSQRVSAFGMFCCVTSGLFYAFSNLRIRNNAIYR